MPDAVLRLWGTLMLGLGAMMLYGGYANKKVFGKGGLIVTALTTGKLDTSKIPPLNFHASKASASATPTPNLTNPLVPSLESAFHNPIAPSVFR